MDDEILYDTDPSGKVSREIWLEKNQNELYNKVINFCIENNLNDLPFKQKVYHYKYRIIEYVKCKNKNCNNLVNFKSSTLGYYKYCSNYCIGSDDEMKNTKKQTSLEKYSVEHYAKTDESKNKAIETNLEKYKLIHPSQRNEHKEIIKECLKNYQNRRKIKFLKKYKENGLLEIKDDNICECYCKNCDNYFEIDKLLFKNRIRTKTVLCNICNPIYSGSGQQKLLYDFIKSNYNKTILQNNRKTLNNIYELDIYLPELKLAFEFNGLYWHNEKQKDKCYHQYKTIKCKENNISLIHVYEDDWSFKENIVKAKILKLINSETFTIIKGEDCTIRNVNSTDIDNFLNKNSFNYIKNYTQNIGLYYKNILVSLMLMDNNEIIYFDNDLDFTVKNSENILFDYIVKHNNFKYYFYYSDNSWNNNLINLNFNFINITEPNFYNILNNKRIFINENKTDLLKIYDSGYSKYEVYVK